MNASDLTIFLISCSHNPNRCDCLAAIQAQTAVQAGATVKEIRNVAPMSKAFQAMLDQCETPFFAEIDEDMILDGDALAVMLDEIIASPPDVAFVVYMLHDAHLDRPLQGVKCYRHAIMVKYPYADDVSCEKSQLERLLADGYRIIEHNDIELGEHSPKWTPRLIFNRYFRLMEKWKVYGYSWLENLPAELLAKYVKEPSDINRFAFLGAWASASRSEPLISGEDDFRVPSREYLRARGWFSQPTQATFYLTDQCNLKCGWCLRQGQMAQVSPARPMDTYIIDETAFRFPSIRSVCLCGFGETLLHPDIGRIIDACKHYGWWTGIITNGVLLKESWGELVRHRPSSISISLNAASAAEHAQECSVPGQWQTIMEGIALAGKYQEMLAIMHSSDCGIPIYLSRVCTKQNLHLIPDFLEMAMHLPCEIAGIDLHNILPHHVCSPETEAAFMESVLTMDDWAKIAPMKDAAGAHLVRSWPVLIDPDCLERRCEFPFQSIAVDGNRNISVCNSVMPPQPCNGGIRNPKCWQNDYAQGVRLRFADKELPAHCRLCFRNWC